VKGRPQIESNDPIKFFDGVVEYCLSHVHRWSVNQNVRFALLCSESVDCRIVEYVNCYSSETRTHRCSFFRMVEVRIGADDASAMCCEGKSTRATDATAGTDHDSAPAIESEEC
jgi:hypothetical protein